MRKIAIFAFAWKARPFAFAGLPYLLQEFRAKKYFTDHYTPNAIDGFGDSVLVCKMHDYYCRMHNIPFYPIQVMQAITINKMGS